MRHLATLTLILSSAAVLTACGSSVRLDDNAKIEDRSVVPATPATTAPIASADTRSVATVNTPNTSNDPLNDQQGVLSKRSVYFDYDSFIVKDEFKPVVEAHARYLSTHKGRKIIIQGNTDDRGGREYNLALGQKRAEAVRKALSLQGVPDSQMEAVSLGEEKPRATGSDEAAWAENRRSDIVY